MYSIIYNSIFEKIQEKSRHPEVILEYVSLKLEISWTYCCVVSRTLEKPYRNRSFVGLLLRIHVQFNFNGIFGKL